MLPRRVILALTLALAWCWGTWHADLEAAGWLLHEHHQHHHDHHDQVHRHAHPPGSPGHTPVCGDDHEPVWARSLSNDARGLPFQLMLLGALALAGVPSFAFRPTVADAPLRGRTKRRARDFDPVWQFVRRCAPDVAAPPALS